MVMFLYREDYYNKDTERKDVAEVIIAKQRTAPSARWNWPGCLSIPNFANMQK